MTSDTIVVDASSLTEFQACKRRFLLSHDWRQLRWRPKSLFDALLRQGVVALSTGQSVETVVKEASVRFFETASNPGLDLAGDTYTAAKDYCAMLSTVLRSIARLTLLTLHEVPTVFPNSKMAWRFSAMADDSGQLHRWITVDSWGEDDVARALHGWHCIGDIAFSRMPMMLHVVEIGQVRSGRRASPWARGWKHPGLPNLRMRFKRTDGLDFQGWKPVWLADLNGGEEAEQVWVEQLWREKVAEGLMRHVTVECPADQVCFTVMAQVMQEAVEMRELVVERGSSSYAALPMSRPACDSFVPCPFQQVCYRSEELVTIEDLGLYQRREVKGVKRAAATQSA